jgi:REP element-mobilizing transposase RayT
MSQSLAQIYVHIIFSTKNRIHLIDEDISDELYAYLGGACKALDCPPVKTGGYYDHVHILCKLSKKITLIKLLEEVKKPSSKWIKTKGSKYSNFYWQDGYAAFSVNPAEIDPVINYISHQKEHHRKVSFQEECRSFFQTYNIDYDERYVWD